MKSLQESLLDNDDILIDDTDIDSGFPDKKEAFIPNLFRSSKAYWWKSPRIALLMQKYYKKSCGILIKWCKINNRKAYDRRNPEKFKHNVELQVHFSPEKDGIMGWTHKNGYGKADSMLEAKKLAYSVLLKLKDNPDLLDDFINPNEYISINDILDS